jgi:predicted dehydrogenase
MKPEEADLNKENLPWKVRFEQTGGGKFIDMGTHILDLAQYFFGDFVEVKGLASNFGGFYLSEDAVCASFKCKSGVLVNGTWIYAPDCNKEEILIIGSKGSIETGGLAYNSVQVSIDGAQEIKTFAEPEHIAMPYEQMIIDEILGKSTSPADIISAANNVKAMDEILKDYRNKASQYCS